MPVYAKPLKEEGEHDPLGIVESLAAVNHWDYERISEEELTFLVTGTNTDYTLSVTWMGDIESLHIACTFDLKVPAHRLAEVRLLASLVNERLWVGHFDIWAGEGVAIYRYALVLAGGQHASGSQCEAMFGSALNVCEKYFSAFQFVVWAGKPAKEALDAVVFETRGEA